MHDLSSLQALLDAIRVAERSLFSSLDFGAVVMIVGAVFALVRPSGITTASRIARSLGIAIITATLVSSVLVVMEFIFRADFFFEALLLPGIDRESGAPPQVAIPLALSFGLLSLALLVRFRREQPHHDVVDFLALVASIATALLVFIRIQTRWVGPTAVESTSLVTALTLLSLAIAVMVTRPHGVVTRILNSSAVTAQVMRPLLIVTVLTPIATDHLVELGTRLSLYTPAAATALDTLCSTLILLAVTVGVARIVARMELEREEAAAKVRKSESRLQLQMSRMPIACIVRDGGLRVQSWNPAAEAIFGHSEPEMLGRTTDALVIAEHRDRIEAIRRRTLEGQSSTNSITENLTKDGRRIVTRWSNTPLLDDGGKVFAVLSMVEDITEQERTRAELGQSEERYRSLVEFAPNGILVRTGETIVFANPAAASILGTDATNCVGRRILDFIHPLDIEDVRKRMRAVDEGGQSTSVREYQWLRADGSAVSVEAAASPIWWNDALSAQILLRDVTERNSARQELRASEQAVQRLLRAVEQTEEIIFTTDIDGTITYANPAFEKVYGYSREETIGQTPRLLESEQSSQEEYAQFWREILSGRSLRTEYTNLTKDGSLVRVVGSATPVVGETGEITGFIAVHQDVTKQRQADEERRQLDERLGHLAKMEALGTLAGGIAHDFNNILSIILSHATLIERRPGDVQRAATAVATIRQAVNRGAALSRQILTFARRSELNSAPVDIGKVAVELSAMISETFPRTIRLSLGFDSDLPPIDGDSAQIHQALLNLCVNARDAMPSGGTISIDARRVPAERMRSQFGDAAAADHVCLIVGDTGCGMDEETRRRIFEPFFTTKEKGKGTGLGLALVYGVVKSHGGLIEVDSTPGQGTAFRMYFPALRSSVMVEQPDRPSPSRRGGETLLVVDDEELLLTMTASHLRDSGYEVLVAGNGEEAVQQCRRAGGRVDAVVMDLGMPGMTPLELIASLREIVPGVPVIAMTGYVDREMHLGVVAAGVRCILQKPFEPDDLLNRLRAVLDGTDGGPIPPVERPSSSAQA